MSGSHLAGLSGRVVRQVYWFPAHIPEGCQSGRLGTPGERVYPLGTVGSNPTPSAMTAEQSQTRTLKAAASTALGASAGSRRPYLRFFSSISSDLPAWCTLRS